MSKLLLLALALGLLTSLPVRAEPRCWWDHYRHMRVCEAPPGWHHRRDWELEAHPGRWPHAYPTYPPHEYYRHEWR